MVKNQSFVIWIQTGDIVCIKTDDIQKDIEEDNKTRFDTSNYELEFNSIDRTLPKGKDKRVIGLMKDELGGNILTKFVGLRANYLRVDDKED